MNPGTGYDDRVNNLGGRVASVATGLATAIVIVALTILPFLSPAWVAFEQGRAEAAAWTGYTTEELRVATDAILADLMFGGDFAIEVNGQLRHAGDAAVDVDQLRASIAHRQRSGDTEVAVEPRIVEDSAVDLDVQLLPTDEAVVGTRLDAQARRVGMCTGETERCDRRGVGRRAPRHDTPSVEHEPGIRQIRPRVAELELDEAGVEQPCRHRAGGVIRRRRFVEERP